MKAIGLPPSDPRVSQMNDAQWLWCYFNILEDTREEEENHKMRLDYLAWFINPSLAKSVHERNKVSKGNGGKYKPDLFYKNDQFNLEIKAAKLGYDPSMGITPERFLEEYNRKQDDVDVMNDDFDRLVASGEFQEVIDDEPNVVGNPNESFDEFIDRAMALGKSLNQNERGVPIDRRVMGTASDDHHGTDDGTNRHDENDDLDFLEVD